MSNDFQMENSKEVYEFLRNLLLIRKGHAKLFCGSFFELPIQYVIANLTDLDKMHIPTNICALPVNVSASHTFQGKTLIVNTEDTHPGFARLYSPECKQLYHKKEDVLENHCRNGPAWTRSMIHSNDIDYTIKSISEHLGVSQNREIGLYRSLQEMQMDSVYAIYCPCWPLVADEWKTRERPNGWPSVEIIDKIVASGCYFVAKPHHSNPDDDTQWRFSFSHAEVILIHSWTDVQKYIYHILRLIKSEVVKACGGSDETVLCTYFCKTLMFWECERKPKEFWEYDNVENSVMELLCLMIEWLIDGCCPNYFIRNCNMISASTERVDFSKEIQLLLIYTKSNILQISATWPKAYPEHLIGLMEVAIPEKVLLHINLVQVRDNCLNPLYPNTKTHLLKHLTKKNSLLWRQASDLYSGILNHLQLMKTRCPIRKHVFKRVALSHFQSSLMENGDECSKRFISIGESIYEFVQHLSRATDYKFESNRMPKDICNNSSEIHIRGNYRQSPLNSPVKCIVNTHRRFVRCYSRQVESEDDDIENKIANSATIDHLNTCAKRIFQILLVNNVDSVTSTTHVISSGYLANFYYTALQDYYKASALCDTVINYPEGNPRAGKIDLTFCEWAFPIFITNELSAIFDEHFRTVLGLITLYGSIVDSLQGNSTILVRIRPAHILKYLKIQCKRLEGMDESEISEKFECNHVLNELYDTYEPLSQVFMLAVLRASRCKFV